VKIPLVLALWRDSHFGGTKRIFVDDQNDLGDAVINSNFNDQASSVGVHPGPNFNAAAGYTVSLFSDANFSGKEIVLTAGIYPDLQPMDFNDQISSIRFNAPGSRQAGLYIGGQLQYEIGPTGDAAQITPIPAVIELYVAHDVQEGLGGPLGGPTIHGSLLATLVESSLDIGADYGKEFVRSVNVIKILRGPNPTCTVRLYRDANPDQPGGPIQGGGYIELEPAANGTLSRFDLAGAYSLTNYDFANQTSAITVIYRNVIASLAETAVRGLSGG
jgi:hypothetical protein